MLVEVPLCKIDGREIDGRVLGACSLGCWVLRGMQFGVLVEVLFGELDGRVLAVLRA